MAGQGVQQRTGEAIGFPVNLHDFRHAAATFWSIQEPANVRGGGGPSRPFITRDDGKVPLRRSRASPDALSIVPSLVNGKEQGFQVVWAARFGRAVADERRI